MNAAGILFRSPAGRVLLLRRTDGTWDYPGGGAKGDETAEQTALRECWEETGFRAGDVGRFHTRRVKHGVDYTTFLRDLDDEFVPKLSKEHTDYIWIDPERVLLKEDVKADAADWEESDHPRDEGGQFTAGGGAGAAGGKGKEAKPLPSHLVEYYQERVREVKATQPEFVAAMKQYADSLMKFKTLKAKTMQPNSVWSDFEALSDHQEAHKLLTQRMYQMAPPDYFKAVAALNKHKKDVNTIARTVKMVKTKTLEVAKKLNFPANQVDVQYEKRTFMLNGRERFYAGSADISQGDRGKITMYAQNVSERTIPHVAAHEVEHIRYASFQEKREQQRIALIKKATATGQPIGPDNPVAGWNMMPKLPEDQAAFPEWTAWAKFEEELNRADVPNRYKGWHLLAASDGVTPYSQEYWDRFQDERSDHSKELAIHETLAEMMMIHYTTGEHAKEHMWPSKLPHPKTARDWLDFETKDKVMAVGREAWRKLFAMVNP